MHDRKSWSGEAFRRIAARVDGDDAPFLELEDSSKLMSRLKRFVGLGGKDFNSD